MTTIHPLPRTPKPTTVKTGKHSIGKVTYHHGGDGMIVEPPGVGRWNSGGQRKGHKIYGSWHDTLTGRIMMGIEDIPVVGYPLSRIVADGIEIIRRILP